MKTNVSEHYVETSVLRAYRDYKDELDELSGNYYFIVNIDNKNDRRILGAWSKKEFLPSILDKELKREIKKNLEFINDGNIYCGYIIRMDLLIMVVKLSKVKEMNMYYSS